MVNRPVARTRNLLTRDVGDEVVVYDTDRNVACRLNRTADVVWRASDGTRTVPELVALLAEEIGMADEDLVMVALDRLQENGLLESGHVPRDGEVERASRRRFVRRAGAVGGAVLALPLVQGVVIPSPAAAQSPLPTPGVSLPPGTPGPSLPPATPGP
jgi:hypothetical protein